MSDNPYGENFKLNKDCVNHVSRRLKNRHSPISVSVTMTMTVIVTDFLTVEPANDFNTLFV